MNFIVLRELLTLGMCLNTDVLIVQFIKSGRIACLRLLKGTNKEKMKRIFLGEIKVVEVGIIWPTNLFTKKKSSKKDCLHSTKHYDKIINSARFSK